MTGLEIAVIGMAGKFPGAPDIDRFWENLVEGRESLTFFTDEELKSLGVEPSLIRNPNYVKASSIMDRVECFDAPFFGYTPREAELMAPQVRIFHEVTWQALEDAGIVPQSYPAPIGLYAGSSTSAHWEALAFLSGKRAAFGDFATNLLADKDQLCTRISYNLNLRGPSFAVSTACSTSLVAIHLACQGLLSGECRVAAAGGITVTLPRNYGYLYQEGSILSPDAHCRAFDAKAEGSILGEGAGVVILKPLEEAINDRDHIYAVIKGSAINNDGSGKVGYTAPGVKGQANVIRAALHAAEVEPGSIGYIETHGTGTRMGDPIEFNALKMAFNTDKKQFCRIGSVKTNVGHLVHAAGVTGFIKAVLSLYYKKIPPSLFFETPNPAMDIDSSPFMVNKDLYEWKCTGGYPRRAGVSSFGIGGTNAHVILEEAPGNGRAASSIPSTPQPHLFLLSAKTQTALERMSGNFVEFIQTHPQMDLSDAAYTLQTGRMAFPVRRAAVCSSIDEIADAFSSSSSSSTGKARISNAKEEKKTIVFMFAGLGSQYARMASGLYHSQPLFRDTFHQCAHLFHSLTEIDIKELLYPSPTSPNIDEASLHFFENGQLVVFAVEYALAKLLISWGITPHMMTGYSFGEYTAACISGVLSLEDTVKLIAARGRLIRTVSRGVMMSVPLPASETEPLLTGEISLSIDNGPSCIVSGPVEALGDFQQVLKSKHLLAMTLPNSHALHSRMMDPILPELEAVLKTLTFNKPLIPYISNVTGKPITNEEACDPGYWCRHLRETVRFAAGVEYLMQQPDPIFLEIGPGRDLSVLLVRRKEENSTPKAVTFIRPQAQDIPDERFFLMQLGRAWTYGVPIDRVAFNRGKELYRVSLPPYSFEARPYWIDGVSISISIGAGGSGNGIMLPNALPGKKRNSDASLSLDSSLSPTPSPDGDRPELSSDYVPPTDDLEKQTLAIWQDCFGIQRIGIDDDFFELGGDSLLATTMISRLHPAAGVPIPLAEVFKLPTIRKLAAYVRSKGDMFGNLDVSTLKNLIFLKGSTSPQSPILFCIHDIGGDVEGYLELCNTLQTDFNYWGVRADRIQHFTPVNLTVQQLAETYLNQVRQLQPRGPYYLLGWSFGGFVAFEMARLLEQLQEKVAFLGVVDAFVFEEGIAHASHDPDLPSVLSEPFCKKVPTPPKTFDNIHNQEFSEGPGNHFAKGFPGRRRQNSPRISDDFSIESERRWLQEYLTFVDSETRGKIEKAEDITELWPILVGYLESGRFDIRQLKQILPQNMAMIVPNFDRLKPSELIFNLNMLRTFNRALDVFEPTGTVAVPIHFFKAAEMLWKVRTDGWKTYSTRAVEFYEIPGTHFSIFAQPHVAGLAEALEKAWGDLR